jgi:prepilin-type N-terminal cleavage/methylation domain-containing protein
LKTEDHNPRKAPRRHSDAGMTLVEVLISIMLFLIVIGISVPLFTSALKDEPKISKRANQVQRARFTVERIARELRAGYAIDAATPSQLSFRTYNRKRICGNFAILSPSQPATRCSVTYNCIAGTCTRQEQPTSGGGGNTGVFVQGLSSSDVFSYFPDPVNPTYVEIKFIFPSDGGDDAITLEDGIDLRNLSGGV